MPEKVMPTPDPWWSFLEWAGWGGIGGVIALIALVVGVVLGVQALLSGQRDDHTVRFSFSLRAKPVNGRKPVSIEIGAIGPRELFELQVGLLAPDGTQRQLAKKPVQGVRDNDLVLHFDVAVEQIDKYRVVIEWVDVGHSRGRTIHGGTMLSLTSTENATLWKPYLWRLWPRKASGRWVKAAKFQWVSDGAIPRPAAPPAK